MYQKGECVARVCILRAGISEHNDIRCVVHRFIKGTGFPRLQGPKHEYCNNSVIFRPILMKFGMQLSYGHPFPMAKFQQGHKGQRPKGRKVKGQNFKKLAEALLTLFQALCIGFTSFLVLKMVIVEDLVFSVHCVMCFF